MDGLAHRALQTRSHRQRPLGISRWATTPVAVNRLDRPAYDCPALTSDRIKRALAPLRQLRASINLGNPVLAGRDPSSGQPVGVSVDLARELAERVDLDLELVPWDSAGESVDAVVDGLADFGFFAIDPERSQQIAFTAPYVLIQGSYLVAETSELQHNDEVDRPGTVVTVGKGSAYDLYLSRELRSATIERAPTSPAVVEHYLAHGHDVAAGVRQQLEADAAQFGGLRLLPDGFMTIRQAMGLRRDRGEEAVTFITDFLEEMKSSGFVEQSLRDHGIEGAIVAPPETGT